MRKGADDSGPPYGPRSLRRPRKPRRARLYHHSMAEIPLDLPGGELVDRGIADLRAGRESEASLLVAMASPRLRALGFAVPDGDADDPAHRLYALLAQTDPSPHSRYNALVGRITSFARAAEHAVGG